MCKAAMYVLYLYGTCVLKYGGIQPIHCRSFIFYSNIGVSRLRLIRKL